MRDSPYFGLAYYDERSARWFFGREAEIGRIITNLRASRLTLVHAESGVGKSSLLRAGVAARLRELALESVSRGRRVRFIPVVFSKWTDDPLPALISTIQRSVEPFVENGSLELSNDSLSDAIVTAARAVSARLLIILDQFEEYFLYCASENPPQRVADEIARAINA